MLQHFAARVAVCFANVFRRGFRPFLLDLVSSRLSSLFTVLCCIVLQCVARCVADVATRLIALTHVNEWNSMPATHVAVLVAVHVAVRVAVHVAVHVAAHVAVRVAVHVAVRLESCCSRIEGNSMPGAKTARFGMLQCVAECVAVDCSACCTLNHVCEWN